MTERHVSRSRLTDVVGANRVTIVEAGAGYGKSALAAECGEALPVIAAFARLDKRDADLDLFTSRLRRALRVAGLSDLATATEGDPATAIDRVLATLAQTPEPILLVLDDVHDAESDALAAVLVDLAESLPSPHRMLILGRNLTGATKKLRYAHGVAALTAADLAFSDDELGAVLAAHGAAAAMHHDEVQRTTSGWPAAVVLAARRLARDGDATELFGRLTQPQSAVAEMVQLVLDDLSASDAAMAVQLAHLPLLSPSITEAVAGDAAMWARLMATGLSIGATSDGSFELPGPVRDYLAGLAPLEVAVARRAAQAFVVMAAPRAALDVLLAAGDTTAAAAVIVDHAHRGAPPLEFSEIAGVVDALPAEALAAHPRVLLVLARLAGRADRFVHRFAALTRLEEIAAAADDQLLVDELNIEIAHDLLRLYRSEEAAARVVGLGDRLGPDDTRARAQLLAIEGRYASRCGDYDEGARLLHDATKLALQIGDRDHAASCTYALATEALYEAGRMDEALDAAKQSLALASSPAHRLGRLNLIADLATDLGRYEEANAALADQQNLLERHRSDRFAAYVPWTYARIASQIGDTERAKRAIADVERRAEEDWFADSLKAAFFSDAADMLARVGEGDAARRYSAMALELWDGHPCSMIDAMVEARVGDPAAAARKFDALPENRDRREAWRVQLMRALAALRAGDPDAGPLAADAFDRAAADGVVSSLAARESLAVQQLVGLAAAAGSGAAATLLAGELPWTVTLLGGFEVRRGGLAIALPASKSTQAVKLVAALGGRATLDEVVDGLWPEQDLETGRRGVRNLLNRLKPLAPGLLIRDGNDLTLSAATTLDVALFEADAHAALTAAATDPARVGFARAATALYRGELLPSDRFEPWATLPRERLRRRFSDLIDLLIDAAEDSGEIDEAVRLCERAIEVDPYDESRYVRSARLLVARGRPSHARAVIERATAMLSEMGLDPSRGLRDLAAQTQS